MYNFYFYYLTPNPAMTDVSYYVSILSAILNLLIIFVINFLLFNKRRKNERYYLNNSKIFDRYVTPQYDAIIEIFQQYKSHFSILSLEYHDNIQIEKSKIQAKIEELYTQQRNFQNNSEGQIKLYSIELYNELNEVLERYFDESTIIFSKLYHVDSTNVIKKLNQEFNSLNDDFYKLIRGTIQRYYPTE